METNLILWKSGCVKRWHSNIEQNLRDSGDTTGEHSHRVAMLLLMLHPLPSAHLLACALTHDTAEVFTGDMPSNMKTGHLKIVMEKYEDQIAQKFGLPVPSEKDRAWINLCDKLDTILWVREHANYLFLSNEWSEEWGKVLIMSKALNVKDEVEKLMGL